jgi:hypothetical protein
MSLIQEKTTDTKLVLQYGKYIKSGKPKYWSFYLCKDNNTKRWFVNITRNKQRYTHSFIYNSLDLETMKIAVESLVKKSGDTRITFE